MSVSILSMGDQSKPTVDMSMNDNPMIDENRFAERAIHHIVRKLDRRLIPFLCLLEAGSYLNRISIGHAKLMGLNTDLNLSESEGDWIIALFFLAYLIFTIPSNILMRYLGPTRYLSLSMIAWGSITVGMAFVRNAHGLLAVRFLLGVAQAGFFPSIIIYFSLWYRKKDHTMRIAIIFGAAILSSALGSIMAYGFRHMDGIRGLNGWQWMFLIESLPMIPLGVITWLFLDNIPNTVQWLSNIEKQVLTNTLCEDQGIGNRDNVRVSWRQAYYVFIDWRIYLYVLINMGISGLIKYLASYLPLIVKDMVSSESRVHLMTAPPYAFAFVSCLLISYSSSRRNERGFHLMFSLTVALIGFILTLTLDERGKGALYVGSCITCCGVFSALPLLLSWLTNNIDGHTKKSIAIAFVLAMGQIGGIILPLVHLDRSVGQRNNYVCMGAVAGSLLVTIILRISLMYENRRRDLLSTEKYERESAIIEPCDWHPNVRYTL